MADKNINVGINFTANTQQAQNAINQLQQSLNKITFGSAQSLGLKDGDVKKFEEASKAAKDLSYHLNNAYNATTGNFDLSRLDKSLKTSKTNINDLSSGLLQAGETGKEAFMQLAQAISQADQPIISTNKLLSSLWVTMKNTMKWQLTSSMLHGFMGAINQAMGYAKDLNSSLNDIRIVTGKSSDEMERFAVQANKAAKNLSATTTDYTRASLIYYQQGLDGTDVTERADVTVKMANVTGKAAQDVSNQLTAIWNNFYDGSKSLEYYADVITALGSATASSSSEIATGLEKFASVAETVGLSYEYATSALATIVATTRQSADSVGTGLRTIFSRLQSLSLGETLEDGVDLTKYSKALKAVGVDVLGMNGELRDANSLLEDLAGKWQTLGQAEKVALAETVGGVRQYTTLVALMDNWDFMQKNLDVAGGAEGTLQEQADIYAESWQAASKHVKASMEAIYSDIIDDDFFIDFNNGLADVIDGVDHFIDSVGGIGPIIMGVGSIFLSTLSSKIEPAINKLQYNISVLTKGAGATYSDFIGKFRDNIEAQINQYDFTETEKTQLNTSMQMAQVKNRLAQAQDSLNEKELQGAQIQQASIEHQREVVVQLQQEADELKKIYDQKVENFTFDKDSGSKELNDTYVSAHLKQSANMLTSGDAIGGLQQAQAARELTLSYKELESASDATAKSIIEFWQSNQSGEQQAKQIINVLEKYQEQLNRITNINLGDKDLNFQVMKEEVASVITELNPFVGVSEQASKAIETLKAALQSSQNKEELITAISKARGQLEGFTIDSKTAEKVLQQLAANGFKDIQQAFTNFNTKASQAKTAFETFEAMVNKFNPTHTISSIEAISKSMAGLGSMAMALNSFKSAFEALSNPDISGLEKFTSVVIPLSMGFGMITSSANSFLQAFTRIPAVVRAATAAQEAEVAISNQVAIAHKVETMASGHNLTQQTLIIDGIQKKITVQELERLSEKKNNEEKLKSVLASKLNLTAEQQEVFIKERKQGVTVKEALASALNAKAEVVESETHDKNTKSILAELFAQSGLNMAKALAIVGIAALVAITLLAIKAVKNHKTEQEKANEEYQKSQETLKGLTDAYNEAASAVNNFKSAISNYDEAHKALDTLVKGTTEWTEALAKNNDEVMKLITAYPELQAVVTSNNGVLTLDKTSDVYKNYEQQINDTVQQHQNAVMAGQLASVRAKNNADIYDLQAKVNETKYYYTPIPGKEEEVSKSVYDKQKNGTIGHLYTAKSERNLTIDQIRELKAAIKAGQYELTENGYKFNSDELNSALGENTTALYELISSLKNEIAVEDNLSEAMVDQVNQDNDKYTNSIAQNVIKQIGAQTIESRKEAVQDQVKNGNQLAEQYKNMFGYSDLKFEKLSDGDYSFYTGEGDQKTESFKIAEDNMRSAVEEALAADLSDIDISSWERSVLALAQQLADAAGIELADAVGLISYKDDGNKDKVVTKDELIIDTNNLTEEQAAKFYHRDEGYQKYVTKHANDYADPFHETYDPIKDRASAAREYRQAGKEYEAYEEARRNQRSQENLAWSDEQNDAQKLAYGKSELDLDNEAVEQYAANIENLNDNLKGHKDIVDDVVEENLKNAANYKKLTKAFKDYDTVLKEGDETSDEYAKAVSEIHKATTKWLGVDLGEEFFKEKENLDLVTKAAENNGDAIQELQKIAAKKIALDADINPNVKTNLTKELDYITQNVDLDDIEIGTKLDTVESMSNLTNFLEQMIADSKMAVETANGILENYSFNPDIQVEEIPVTAFNEESFKAGSDVTVNGTAFSAATSSYHINRTTGTVRLVKVNGTKTNNKSGGGAPAKASGGGGGGGSKKKDKKVDDERDRYHTVTQQLEDLNNNMDKLGDLSERAFGAEKLANMQAQVDLYDDLITKQQEYIDEIKSYLALDTQKLSILGLGATFDENGVITNYDQIMEQLVNAYNSGGLDDDTYEERKKAIDQYVESVNLLQEETRNLTELINKQDDALLKLTTTEVEIKVKISDSSLKILEYYLGKLDDDAYDGAEKLAFYSSQFAENMAQSQAYIQGIGDIIGNGGLTTEQFMTMNAEEMKQWLEDNHDKFTQEAMDTLMDYIEELIDTQKKMDELSSAIRNQFLDTLNAWDEKLDGLIDRYDHLNNVAQAYLDIVDLIGKRTLGIDSQMLSDMRQVQVDNAVNAVRSNYDELKWLEGERERAMQQLDAAREAQNEEAVRDWEKMLEEIDGKVRESTENLNSALTNAIQAAADMYESQIKTILDDWERRMSPIYSSLEALSQAFEHQNMINDQYLEDYEKIYELNKLGREISKAIDDTDNIQGKKKLIGLLDEINQLQDGDNQISEYSLEVLQKRFELKKAELALEEAQNAKDTVRLRQDNEGNWGYVYTADTEAVESAEQEYADKLYELQQLNNEYIQTLQENILQMERDMRSEIEALNVADFASEKEYYDAITEIRDTYYKQYSYLISEFGIVLGNNQELYNNEMIKYSEMTGTKIIEDKNWIDRFEETKLAEITGYGSLHTAQENFELGMEEIVEKVCSEYNRFQQSSESALEAAGTSMKQFAEDFGNKTIEIGQNSEDLAASIEETTAVAQSEMNAVLSFIENWSDQYKDAISEIVGFNNQLIDSCNSLITKLAEVEAEQASRQKEELERQRIQQEEEAKKQAATEAAKQNTSTSSGGGGGESYNEHYYTIKVNGTTYYGTSASGLAKYVQQKTSSQVSADKIDELRNKGTIKLDSGGYTGRMEYADTGMYTGEWPNGSVHDNGRLAFLHQKELVLNAHDTENFLDAIEIVRQIAKAIDLGAASAKMGLGNIFAPPIKTVGDTLEQHVEITASFPNVQDRNEIEEAFNNLLGRATQFAHRKK